jgi:hypothetical protein
MRKLVKVFLIAVILSIGAAQIERRALAYTITQLHDIALNGPNAVSYTFFTVTTAGLFNISADGLPTYTLANPQIYLFTDNGSPGGALTGTFIAADDDSGPGENSLIANQSLSVGNYAIAVGANLLSDASARSDSNPTGCCSGTVLVTISSEGGAGILQVPEPGSFILVGLGLLALRFARRWF